MSWMNVLDSIFQWDDPKLISSGTQLLSKKLNYPHKLFVFIRTLLIRFFHLATIFHERFSIFFTIPVIILSLTGAFEHCYLKSSTLKSFEQQYHLRIRASALKARILRVIARVLATEYCNWKWLQMCRR